MLLYKSQLLLVKAVENTILDGFKCQNEKPKLYPVSKVKAISVYLFFFNGFDLLVFAIENVLKKETGGREVIWEA